MIAEPSFYAVALPAVVLYGLSKGGFVGVSLLAVPLMSLVMSPVQAAAILLPVLLVQDVVTIYAFRRDWDREMLTRMLPGAIIGIGFGALTAAVVPLDIVRFTVGVMAIAFCVNYWLGPDLRNQPPAAHANGPALLFSALSGYTSFVLHAGGPPFNMYALPRVNDVIKFAGTSGVFFGLVNVLKVPPYLWLGQFTVTNLTLSASLLPVAIAGNVLGIRLVRKMPKTLFYRLIYGLTALIGGKLVVESLSVFNR